MCDRDCTYNSAQSCTPSMRRMLTWERKLTHRLSSFPVMRYGSLAEPLRNVCKVKQGKLHQPLPITQPHARDMHVLHRITDRRAEPLSSKMSRDSSRLYIEEPLSSTIEYLLLWIPAQSSKDHQTTKNQNVVVREKFTWM